MIKWPTKLAGVGSQQRWLNLFLGASKSGELVDGPGYRVKRSTRGTSLDIDFAGGASGGKFDFLLCRNGEQIRVKIASDKDPTTVEPDTGEEEEPPTP